MVSYYRDLTFEVEYADAIKLFSFEKMKRSFGAIWQTHGAINGRERIEKTGIKLQDMGFSILLRSDAGISAREKIDLLQSYVEDGKSGPFILGSYCITGLDWVMQSVSTVYNMIIADGEILSATVDVTMKQYF